MANMIASTVIALNHLQNSDESQHLKATELLERVIQDLNVFSKPFLSPQNLTSKPI